MNLKKVLCAALSTVTAVSLLASCGGKGKMQMDKAELTGPKAYDEQTFSVQQPFFILPFPLQTAPGCRRQRPRPPP